jgi:two-component sensor histidine kinase
MTQCRELIEYVITENGTGFNTGKKEGFGLKLIAILVRQIGGTLTINSNKNEGLEHKIVFIQKE